MYRYALDYLLKWKDKPSRRPLVVRGARQVGKSYLVRMFGKEAFDSIVEVDFELEPDVAGYFESPDPKETVRFLEAHYKTRIIRQTVL